jgi:hypothetical protein
LILRSNERRKEEVRDETVQREVEKVKRRAEALKKKLARTLGYRE